MCNKDGDLNVILNMCLYCGVILCCCKCGNKMFFICFFYGWIFNNLGKFLKVCD